MVRTGVRHFRRSPKDLLFRQLYPYTARLIWKSSGIAVVLRRTKIAGGDGGVSLLQRFDFIISMRKVSENDLVGCLVTKL